MKWLFFPLFILFFNLGQAQGNDIIFLIDNSISITDNEYTEIQNSVNEIMSGVLSCPDTRVAVVHHGGVAGTCDYSINVEIGFTNVSNTQFQGRPLTGNDNLHDAMELLGNALDGQLNTDNVCIGGVPLNYDPANNLRIFVFSDAFRNNGISSMINTDVPASVPPGSSDALFQEYLNFKEYRGATFYVLHDNSDNVDNSGQQAAATIASAGGTWPSDSLEGYPSDPDAGQDRYFYNVTNYDLSRPEVSHIVNDLCSDNTQPDPCDEASLTIISNLPNCEDLNSFATFPITASINLPAGYTSQNASTDFGLNRFTLDIIDMNDPDPNAVFMTLNSSDINNGTFEGNTMQITYMIGSDQITNMTATSYEFKFNANLNGTCQLNDTIQAFSLVGCDETSVDLNPINEDCNKLGDTFSLNICGSFSTSLIDNAFLNEPLLQLEILHPFGDQVINVQLSLPFASNEFCFTVTEADLPYGLTGNYDFRVRAFFSDDNNPSFTRTDLEQGIDFTPCQDTCEAASNVVITSEVPQCLNDTNNFEVCATLTIIEEAEISNVGMRLFIFNDSGNFSYIFDEQDLAFTTNPDGSRSADFCYEVNVNDFPSLEESYTMQINYGIFTRFEPFRCVISSDPVSINPCGGRKKSSVKLYPTIAKNHVTVSSPDKKISSLLISDLSGNHLIRKNQLQTQSRDIDINKLKKGIYLINIEFEDGSTARKKFIKD